MSDIGKNLSVQIMEALKDLLPKETGFIMICGDVTVGDLSITSNMPDDLAIQYLENAVFTIGTSPSTFLENEIN